MADRSFGYRSMLAHPSLIDELETAAAGNDVGRRADALRRLTDLFLSGWSRYSDDQIELFDEVMCRLVVEVEAAVRAAMAERLAPLANAPRSLIRKLATDDAIEVAGPVLAKSPQIDDMTLIEVARTKRQEHLLAIAKRASIAATVTDILIERGEREVTLTTVQNPGAQLSDYGCQTVVARARNDESLAISIWARGDIPRHHLVRLFADSCEAVRIKLETQDRRRANLIRSIVADVSEDMQTKARANRHDYQRAQGVIDSLLAEGRLDASHLRNFANAGAFDETAIALAAMCRLPLDVVERGLVHDRAEPVLVFARSIGLDWHTTHAILVLAGAGGYTKCELDEALAHFTRLKPETAQKAVAFYRLRAEAWRAARSRQKLNCAREN